MRTAAETGAEPTRPEAVRNQKDKRSYLELPVMALRNRPQSLPSVQHPFSHLLRIRTLFTTRREKRAERDRQTDRHMREGKQRERGGTRCINSSKKGKTKRKGGKCRKPTEHPPLELTATGSSPRLHPPYARHAAHTRVRHPPHHSTSSVVLSRETHLQEAEEP